VSIPRIPHLATSLEIRDSPIGDVLCLGVVCAQDKVEIADEADTIEGEPAGGMIDEKCRRDCDRARLTVTTTR